MPKTKKSINFEEDNHAIIASLRLKYIMEKQDGKVPSLEDTVMRAVKKELETEQ